MKSGQVKSVKLGIGLVGAGQVGNKSSQDRYGWVRSRRDKSIQEWSSWDHVKSRQVKSGQVKVGQVELV